MLQRKITKEIEKWFSQNTTALLIDGARQVGKTTAIDAFLEENKLHYVKLNLYENKLAKRAFDNASDTESLLLRIKALTKDDLDEGTIIFIDEIQEPEDAITPIKFLVQETKYRFILSGSLLDVKAKEIASIPAGFLSILNMYPMDFEEFLWANGVSKKIIAYLKGCFEGKKPVDEIIHSQMFGLFNAYLAIGGMPKAVSVFVESKNLGMVNASLSDVDEAYRADIAKYKKNAKLLLDEIYDLIPSELSAQNKRFILKNLNEKARFYQCETSFAWLKNSGVGVFAHNVDNPVFPLLASKERTLFKLFLCDTGLLSFKLYNGNQGVLLDGPLALNCGAIYENVVAQELKAHGFELYYNNDKKRGEIDFLIEKNSKVIPIEVKSGKDYRRHNALTSLLSNDCFGYELGYVFSKSNVKTKGKIIYLPIYMVMFLENRRNLSDRIINLDISSLI
jgi:uncharacterized protein